MEDSRFHALIEHSRDAIWLLNAAGAIVYASPASERVLGYRPAELTGVNAFDFVLPSDRAEARARLTENGSASMRLRRKDGLTIWVDAAGARIADSEGGIVISIHDITERRLAEQLLRQSEQRFRALIEKSADGFVLLDREGRITYSGPPVLGFVDKEFLGHSVLEVIHPDDLEVACANLAEIVTRPGRSSTLVYRARHADGSWRWMEVRATNLLGDPAVGGLVVNYRDITERKQHEEESHRVRNEMCGVLESIQECFLAVDREWRFTYVNRRVASFTGKDPGELLGKNLWELFPAALETEFYPQYQRVMRDRVAAQFEVYNPALARWFDVHAYPTGDGLSAYVLDITERKRAEQRFAAQHAVTKILSECSTLADIAPRVLQALGENLGWALGVYWAVDPAVQALRCDTVWPSASAEGKAFAEHCRDLAFHKGEGLPGAVWARAGSVWVPDAGEIRADGLRSGLAFPLLRGPEVLGVLEFFSRDAREEDPGLVRLMEGVGVQIGQFVERKRLEEQLHQSQKLEGLGILAGGVAHDFNNLLTGIMSNASLASSSLPPGSPARSLVADVVQAAESASGLTRQLLAYAAGGRLAPELIDLSKLAHGIAGLLRRSIPSMVEVRLGLRPGLPAIEGDTAQLQQVLMNMVINAAEAIGAGKTGTVQVSTGVQEVDERCLRKAYGASAAAPGRHVYLEVGDNGRGMDEATRARIFDPFFTTKSTGRGLGLAAVLGTVSAHKGALRVDSAPGRGSAFRLLFPVAAGAAAEPVTRMAQDLAGSGTVLVVDDEELVRRAAQQALERFGYTVLTAPGGREAVAMLSEDDSIEVVILDLTMPVMNGAETLDCIRQMRPGLPVVLSSGYNEVDATRRFGSGVAAVFLQKPYTAARLSEKVKAALQTV
jgi:two-component system cell cycle sensor histidine kinase/response regulator CckA